MPSPPAFFSTSFSAMRLTTAMTSVNARGKLCMPPILMAYKNLLIIYVALVFKNGEWTCCGYIFRQKEKLTTFQYVAMNWCWDWQQSMVPNFCRNFTNLCRRKSHSDMMFCWHRLCEQAAVFSIQSDDNTRPGFEHREYNLNDTGITYQLPHLVV